MIELLEEDYHADLYHAEAEGYERGFEAGQDAGYAQALRELAELDEGILDAEEVAHGDDSND